MIVAAKNKDTAKDCEEAKGSSKKMWKVINKAINRKPKPNTLPAFIKTKTTDGVTKRIYCKTKIADAMNTQFTEMGGKLAAELESTDSTYSDYLRSPNPQSLFLKKATEPETRKHIDEADIKKATGIDKIPAKVLKWAIDLFAPILTKLFNKCIEEGVYPDSLKLARVTPVFKGGNQNETTSYRPISILTQINRVFEKLLRDRLYSFLGKKIYKKQFGFQPKHSTEQPILDLKEHIFKNCS